MNIITKTDLESILKGAKQELHLDEEQSFDREAFYAGDYGVWAKGEYQIKKLRSATYLQPAEHSDNLTLEEVALFNEDGDCTLTEEAKEYLTNYVFQSLAS